MNDQDDPTLSDIRSLRDPKGILYPVKRDPAGPELWNQDTLNLFKQWTVEFQHRETIFRRLFLFWKAVGTLAIPVFIIMYIFGAQGLTTDSSSNAQSIVLLVAGTVTAVLERLKPKKYQLYYKDRCKICGNIVKRLNYELAKPLSDRKSPDAIIKKIKIETKLVGIDMPSDEPQNAQEPQDAQAPQAAQASQDAQAPQDAHDPVAIEMNEIDEPV